MKVTNPVPVATFRDLLTARLGELRAEVQAAEQACTRRDEAGREVTDRKEEAEFDRVSATEDVQVARDLAELRQVEEALQRLDSGRYGLCNECGEPITQARLLVQPAAPRCTACQTAAERSAS